MYARREEEEEEERDGVVELRTVRVCVCVRVYVCTLVERGDKDDRFKHSVCL